jgi:protein-L-isoaspartate O-methyltransferase
LRRRQMVYSSALALLMAAVLLATRIAVAADSEVSHIVQILGLKSDSLVVGAGSGEKSVAIASRVPRGIVYSTEVDPQLIDKIRNNVRKAQASNVIVITGRADETQLPAEWQAPRLRPGPPRRYGPATPA